MSSEKQEVDEKTDEKTEPVGRQYPFVVTLKYPIKQGSETISSLEFRRGRAGDMKGIALRDDLPANDLMLIASRLCGVTPKVIEMLDIDDAGEVNDIALDFYMRYLKAGRKG